MHSEGRSPFEQHHSQPAYGVVSLWEPVIRYWRLQDRQILCFYPCLDRKHVLRVYNRELKSLLAFIKLLLIQESYLQHSLACIIKLANCSCLVYNSTVNDVSNVQKMLCGGWQNFLNIFLCTFCNTTQMQSCQTMHHEASNNYQLAKRQLLYLAIACPD